MLLSAQLQSLSSVLQEGIWLPQHAWSMQGQCSFINDGASCQTPRHCCNKALLLHSISPFFWCWYLNLDASSILSVWVPCNGVCWQMWLLLDYCLLVDLEVAISISNKPSKRFKMIPNKTLSCFRKSQLASNVLAALFMSRLATQLGAAFTFSALLLHAIMQWDCLQA